ncbi:hypothetical protein ACQVUL_03910 [Bacillus cytotoxicus]
MGKVLGREGLGAGAGFHQKAEAARLALLHPDNQFIVVYSSIIHY